MSQDKIDNTLGFVLKSLLKARSLSMRKLSVMTGIDTATISRIINGKQTARHEHLQKLAHVLDVPMKRLLVASGYDLEDKKDELGFQAIVDTVNDTLEYSNLLDQNNMAIRVEKELDSYQQYAQTEEGERVIHKEFFKKVKQVNGMGPFIENLKQMYSKYVNENTSMQERVVLGGTLLYFILPMDIVPDFLFPVGYLDDAFVVQLALSRISKL